MYNVKISTAELNSKKPYESKWKSTSIGSQLINNSRW